LANYIYNVYDPCGSTGGKSSFVKRYRNQQLYMVNDVYYKSRVLVRELGGKERDLNGGEGRYFI